MLFLQFIGEQISPLLKKLPRFAQGYDILQALFPLKTHLRGLLFWDINPAIIRGE